MFRRFVFYRLFFFTDSTSFLSGSVALISFFLPRSKSGACGLPVNPHFAFASRIPSWILEGAKTPYLNASASGSSDSEKGMRAETVLETNRSLLFSSVPLVFQSCLSVSRQAIFSLTDSLPSDSLSFVLILLSECSPVFQPCDFALAINHLSQTMYGRFLSLVCPALIKQRADDATRERDKETANKVKKFLVVKEVHSS